MRSEFADVAIVGGGYTGAALAVHMLRLLPDGARVVLFGAPGRIGRGLAYGTDSPDHLLNVRAGRMSLIADDMLHFTRWLMRSGHARPMQPSEAAEHYFPRRVYGEYIRDTLERAIAAVAGRIDVEIAEAEVTGVRAQGSQFVVEVAGGRRVTAASVALCAGNRPAGLPIAPDRIDRTVRDRVIVDPWADRRVRDIPADARVLLVGTGLTMIDQILTLLRSGHAGPITAVSRHGYLPEPHKPYRTDPKPTPPAEARRSLARLYRWVVAAARAEAADGGDWRAIIDGLRPVTQPTWRAWSVEDRRRFHRHLDSLWSVHRHRMAPSIAARIDELRQAGRLDIIAGRVLALDGADGAVTASLRPRGGTEEIQRTVDWVINSSGVRPAVSEPLVRTMQQSGLARPDLLARGLEVDPRGRVVGRNGLPSPGLFALGPLCAGTFLEITAVPDIREQCAAVAEQLARRVTGRVGTAGLAVPRSAASQPC